MTGVATIVWQFNLFTRSFVYEHTCTHIFSYIFRITHGSLFHGFFHSCHVELLLFIYFLSLVKFICSFSRFPIVSSLIFSLVRQTVAQLRATRRQQFNHTHKHTHKGPLSSCTIKPDQEQLFHRLMCAVREVNINLFKQRHVDSNEIHFIAIAKRASHIHITGQIKGKLART